MLDVVHDLRPEELSDELAVLLAEELDDIGVLDGQPEFELVFTGIVRSTVDLAHNLGLTVVAEGVENALIWDKLKALHCDEAQGYFMSKPIAAHAFAAWCEAWDARQPQSASIG